MNHREPENRLPVGMEHELLLALYKGGVTKKIAQEIINEPELLKEYIEKIKKIRHYIECTWMFAKLTMGENFIGPMELKEIFRGMNVVDLDNIPPVPFSKEMIEKCAKTHMLRFGLPYLGLCKQGPQKLTILTMIKEFPELFSRVNHTAELEYEKCSFAIDETPQPCWQMIPLNPPIRENRPLDHWQEWVGKQKKETMGNAVEYAYTMLLMLLSDHPAIKRENIEERLDILTSTRVAIPGKTAKTKEFALNVFTMNDRKIHITGTDLSSTTVLHSKPHLMVNPDIDDDGEDDDNGKENR